MCLTVTKGNNGTVQETYVVLHCIVLIFLSKVSSCQYIEAQGQNETEREGKNERTHVVFKLNTQSVAFMDYNLFFIFTYLAFQ
jgi:hypothetical protein